MKRRQCPVFVHTGERSFSFHPCRQTQDKPSESLDDDRRRVMRQAWHPQSGDASTVAHTVSLQMDGQETAAHPHRSNRLPLPLTTATGHRQPWSRHLPHRRWQSHYVSDEGLSGCLLVTSPAPPARQSLCCVREASTQAAAPASARRGACVYHHSKQRCT
eukprot:COSAG06_NODE_3886_length_4803_cov_5.573342_2_plen_160_part_00